MSDLPWFRFYPSDWLGGTRGMKAIEAGIYITLIATMYERETPLPEDTGRLARLCGASHSAFKAALEVLVTEGKIERVNGGLWNKRVGREVENRAEKVTVARQNAKQRWDASEEKTQQKQQSENAVASKPHCKTDASQRPETRDQNSKKDLCRTKPPYSESFDVFWRQWRDLDRKRGGPLWSTHSKATAARQWVKLSAEDQSQALAATVAYQDDCKKSSHDPKHAERYLRDRLFENYNVNTSSLTTFTAVKGTPEHDAWSVHKRNMGVKFIPPRMTVPSPFPPVDSAPAPEETTP